MMTSLATMAAMALGAGAASAQQGDEEWLRQCHRDAERQRQATVCQVVPASTQLASGALSVHAGLNGGISVQGDAAARDVRVSARIQARADTEERAWELARAVRLAGTPGSVSATGLVVQSGESWTVNFALTVPRRADLDLDAQNGPLVIREVHGRIRAITTNGPVVLEGVGGDVHARSTNGPLTVRLNGSRWEGAGLDAATRNGPVALSIPDGFSAELTMSTSNGPISTAVPVTVTGSLLRGGQLQTTLGSGGAPIRIATTNGPAVLNRRTDLERD